MYIYKSRFLVRGEVWYDSTPDNHPVDWILYRQRSQPVAGARWRYFYTMVVDLTHSPEELLARMSESILTRVKRMRNGRKVTCEWLDPLNPKVMDAFEQMYNRFAELKGLGPLDRKELQGLAEGGELELSVAKDEEGTPLVYQVYYHGRDRSCLMHSASLYQKFEDSATRNAIGRANVFLVWCNMLRHKQQGLKCFDFGGWYPGHTDQALLGINRFKEGFGGRVVREYNSEQIVSLKGLVVLTVARGLRKVSGLRSVWRGWQSGPSAHQECRQEPAANILGK